MAKIQKTLSPSFSLLAIQFIKIFQITTLNSRQITDFLWVFNNKQIKTHFHYFQHFSELNVCQLRTCFWFFNLQQPFFFIQQIDSNEFNLQQPKINRNHKNTRNTKNTKNKKKFSENKKSKDMNNPKKNSKLLYQTDV